ncbi:hypothetical protein HQ590_14075 [bacterium]|nr:hypothetical protein [bacterium]
MNPTASNLVEPLPCTNEATPAGSTAGAALLAERLDAGMQVKWPRRANAVRAYFDGGKSTVLMRPDADTLRHTGCRSAVFGWVPYDSKGRPRRERFEPVANDFLVSMTEGTALPTHRNGFNRWETS